MTKPGYLPEVYHPNALDLHMDEIREQATASLGLSDKVEAEGYEALDDQEAAQLGQAIADRSEALLSNVNQQSE
jgi:hypothetical protein